jgi:hypothetical protein
MSAGVRFTIRHRPPATWPTAEEAACSRWFSPARIGPLTVAERTWVPAMVPWRATEDGVVTPEVLQWYARFADGQPGVLVVEATGIRDVASGPLLRIGDDRFLPGLRRLVETVREHSGGRTRLFIQAIDFLAVRSPTREVRRASSRSTTGCANGWRTWPSTSWWTPETCFASTSSIRSWTTARSWRRC